MSVDFPRAWEITKATAPEFHDSLCSYRQVKMLCDCHVLMQHPEKHSNKFFMAGGVIKENNGSSVARRRRDSLHGGEKFGELTVVSYSHSSVRRDGSAGERVMNCVCSCGKKVKVRSSNLKSGHTTSCGHIQRERTIKSNIRRSKP